MGLHWATPGHLLNTDVFLGDINQFVAKVGKKLSTLETPHLINQLCPEAFLIRTFLGPIQLNLVASTQTPDSFYQWKQSYYASLQYLRYNYLYWGPSVAGSVCTLEIRDTISSLHYKSTSVTSSGSRDLLRQYKHSTALAIYLPASSMTHMTQHQANTGMEPSVQTVQTVVTVGTRAVNKPSWSFTVPLVEAFFLLKVCEIGMLVHKDHKW